MYGHDIITVKRGDIQSYWGKDVYYSTNKQLKALMIKYAVKIMDKYPEKIASTATSPATQHIFKIQGNSERKVFPKEQTQYCHHAIAQLLFLAMQARPILQTLVSFLTKQVTSPDDND